MGAYVEHAFTRGYLLDEERLRKIHHLIESRLSKFSPPLSLRYNVFRGDPYAYDTDSLEQVAAEDNELQLWCDSRNYRQ